MINDRVGRRLFGGGDTELTTAIRLAGWKIRVEPRLRLQHFMCLAGVCIGLSANDCSGAMRNRTLCSMPIRARIYP